MRGAAVGEGGRINGFLALKLLGKRFNPKTPGKGFQALLEILTPGAIKEDRDIPRGVEEWELKCAKVKEEYGEREGLRNRMMVAVLIAMIPKEMQDMVYQMGRLDEDLPYQ